jgi:hypothetical protein
VASGLSCGPVKSCAVHDRVELLVLKVGRSSNSKNQHKIYLYSIMCLLLQH